MSNRDFKLLDEIVQGEKEVISKIIEEVENEYDGKNIDFKRLEHPLDKEVISLLNDLKSNMRSDDDDYHIFNFIEKVKKMWKIIIAKSIKCLRFFDTREYFEEYSEFESMLYGGGKYYRDHVVHVFRVWLLGVVCLLDQNAEYLKKITIEKDIKVNSLEKISIWSMIALTHDLGYPLEKSQEIIDKTKHMMQSFVSNPIISMDLSFNGVQNNMNDFVIRFMSSKMHEVSTICPKEENKSKEEENKSKEEENKSKEEKKYVARLQPKFYFKFQKSLENCKHGILSSIIIYKLLIYFLESDFNINEDYTFNEEDARQFYIRREILRSIASHTCHDIYHLNMLSFAYLLIIVDDSQEWGRKRLSELYVKSNSKYEFVGICLSFNQDTNKQGGWTHKCAISEQFSFLESDIEGVKRILKSIKSQYENYKEIFRDGQDTANRNFIFTKKCDVSLELNVKLTYKIEFKISNDDNSVFKIKLYSQGVTRHKDKYGLKFLEEIYGKNNVKLSEPELSEPDSSEIDFILEDIYE